MLVGKGANVAAISCMQYVYTHFDEFWNFITSEGFDPTVIPNAVSNDSEVFKQQMKDELLSSIQLLLIVAPPTDLLRLP